MENRKLIIAVLTCLFSGIICACLLESCRVNKAAAVPHSVLLPKVYYVPVDKIKLVHDTVKKFDKVELQKYIQEQLKYNNEQYLNPNFKRLIEINGQQAATLIGFQTIIQSMRDRSIRRTDSMNRVSVDKDKKIDQLQQRYFKAQTDQLLKVQAQINDLKQITNFLLALWGIMLFVLFGAGILLTIWWRRIKRKIVANA